MAKPRAFYLLGRGVDASNCPSFNFLCIELFDSGKLSGGGMSQFPGTELWAGIPARRKSKGT